MRTLSPSTRLEQRSRAILLHRLCECLPRSLFLEYLSNDDARRRAVVDRCPKTIQGDVGIQGEIVRALRDWLGGRERRLEGQGCVAVENCDRRGASRRVPIPGPSISTTSLEPSLWPDTSTSSRHSGATLGFPARVGRAKGCRSFSTKTTGHRYHRTLNFKGIQPAHSAGHFPVWKIRAAF